MANQKVYIHEFVDIIGQGRARYMHHMTANWVPVAQRERGQRCFGVWGTVGSTGRWPEVVNLWEEDGWHGLARSFAHELSHPGLQDPSLAAWWAEAARFRRGGVDRLLQPAPWSPTIEELTRDGVCGVVYAHELVQLEPGGSPRYLERLASHGVPALQTLGLSLVGAFETALVNDSECVVIWAIPSWECWAEFEIAQRVDPGIADWREQTRDLALDWQRTLLVDAPLAPLRTGRQPRESDRRPLDEIH